MTIPYTIEQLELLKPKELVVLQCHYCHTPFHRTVTEVKRALNGSRSVRAKFCDRDCVNKGSLTGVWKACTHCGKQHYRQLNTISSTNKQFCSQHCSAVYNNQHKTKGTRRSKLETWLQNSITNLFPNLDISYNTKVNGMELDIYIPSLKLAFEINGVHHYEPIHGLEKLTNIQTNDARKSQMCSLNDIQMVVIDTRQQIKFTPSSSQTYLEEIVKYLVGVPESNRASADSQSACLTICITPT